jgi:GNAT superfamily N-acetyltransferase
MLTIAQISTPEDFDAIRDLIREFTRWVLTWEPGAMSAPTFANLETELAALPGTYGPPTGRFLLARDGGHPVGCVALRALDAPATAELKRMFVRPKGRGKGVGRALVDALIAEARALGIRRVELHTHHTMTGAQRLYRAAGFRDVPPPAGFPEQHVSIVVFMDLDLA